MPRQDYQKELRREIDGEAVRELARRVTRDISPNEIDEILGAIRELRDEVAQLRRDLSFEPSIILTGRQVTEVYRRLL